MSDKNPTISICIPVFNRKQTVKRALDSALEQTYQDFEIVAVDNASPDGTFETLAEYAKRDPRVRAYRNETNVGAVRNWMKCVEYSRADLIKFVFSDDWLMPEALNALFLAIRDSPKCAFASCVSGMYIDGRDYPDVYRRGMSGEVAKEQFIWEHATSGETLLVNPTAAIFRREDLLRAIEPLIPGPDCEYCNSHAIGPDLMMFVRMIDKYPSYFHIERKLVMISHSDEEDSISRVANMAGERDRKFGCYMNALAIYLKDSALSDWQKARIRAAMFLRDANLRNLRSSSSRKALKERFGPLTLMALVAFATPSVLRFALHRMMEIAAGALRKARTSH